MELPYLKFKFYGLVEEPFSTVPSPRYVFLTEVHSTALEKTSFVVGAKKGLAAVFGDTEYLRLPMLVGDSDRSASAA